MDAQQPPGAPGVRPFRGPFVIPSERPRPAGTDSKEPPMTTTGRIQLALNVADLDEAVRLYRDVFRTEPNKRRPGYANFAIADPPLKLVLFENPDSGLAAEPPGRRVQLQRRGRRRGRAVCRQRPAALAKHNRAVLPRRPRQGVGQRAGRSPGRLGVLHRARRRRRLRESRRADHTGTLRGERSRPPCGRDAPIGVKPRRGRLGRRVRGRRCGGVLARVGRSPWATRPGGLRQRTGSGSWRGGRVAGRCSRAPRSGR